MWQCQSKRWSHELVQVLHAHNIIWCLYLSLLMEDCIWCWCWVFSTFCHPQKSTGGLSHASAMLSDGHEHSVTYKLMIILRKFDQDAIFGCWIHVHDEFWIWYDKLTCPEDFASCAIQQCVFQFSYSQPSDCVALDSAWSNESICCFEEGSGTIRKSQFESILRAALPLDEILYKEEVWGSNNNIQKLDTKSRQPCKLTMFLPFHLQCFCGKKICENSFDEKKLHRRWIICGPTSRSATTATSKTAIWSSGSYGRAHRWCWRTPGIWRFLIWNRRCIPCSRCRGWDGIVVWFVEICCHVAWTCPENLDAFSLLWYLSL